MQVSGTTYLKGLMEFANDKAAEHNIIESIDTYSKSKRQNGVDSSLAGAYLDARNNAELLGMSREEMEQDTSKATAYSLVAEAAFVADKFLQENGASQANMERATSFIENYMSDLGSYAIGGNNDRFFSRVESVEAIDYVEGKGIRLSYRDDKRELSGGLITSALDKESYIGTRGGAIASLLVDQTLVGNLVANMVAGQGSYKDNKLARTVFEEQQDDLVFEGVVSEGGLKAVHLGATALSFGEMAALGAVTGGLGFSTLATSAAHAAFGITRGAFLESQWNQANAIKYFGNSTYNPTDFAMWARTRLYDAVTWTVGMGLGAAAVKGGAAIAGKVANNAGAYLMLQPATTLALDVAADAVTDYAFAEAFHAFNAELTSDTEAMLSQSIGKSIFTRALYRLSYGAMMSGSRKVLSKKHKQAQLGWKAIREDVFDSRRNTGFKSWLMSTYLSVVPQDFDDLDMMVRHSPEVYGGKNLLQLMKEGSFTNEMLGMHLLAAERSKNYAYAALTKLSPKLDPTVRLPRTGYQAAEQIIMRGAEALRKAELSFADRDSSGRQYSASEIKDNAKKVFSQLFSRLESVSSNAEDFHKEASRIGTFLSGMGLDSEGPERKVMGEAIKQAREEAWGEISGKLSTSMEAPAVESGFKTLQAAYAGDVQNDKGETIQVSRQYADQEWAGIIRQLQEFDGVRITSTAGIDIKEINENIKVIENMIGKEGLDDERRNIIEVGLELGRALKESASRQAKLRAIDPDKLEKAHSALLSKMQAVRQEITNASGVKTKEYYADKFKTDKQAFEAGYPDDRIGPEASEVFTKAVETLDQAFAGGYISKDKYDEKFYEEFDRAVSYQREFDTAQFELAWQRNHSDLISNAPEAAKLQAGIDALNRQLEDLNAQQKEIITQRTLRAEALPEHLAPLLNRRLVIEAAEKVIDNNLESLRQLVDNKGNYKEQEFGLMVNTLSRRITYLIDSFSADISVSKMGDIREYISKLDKTAKKSFISAVKSNPLVVALMKNGDFGDNKEMVDQAINIFFSMGEARRAARSGISLLFSDKSVTHLGLLPGVSSDSEDALRRLNAFGFTALGDYRRTVEIDGERIEYIDKDFAAFGDDLHSAIRKPDVDPDADRSTLELTAGDSLAQAERLLHRAIFRYSDIAYVDGRADAAALINSGLKAARVNSVRAVSTDTGTIKLKGRLTDSDRKAAVGFAFASTGKQPDVVKLRNSITYSGQMDKIYKLSDKKLMTAPELLTNINKRTRSKGTFETRFSPIVKLFDGTNYDKIVGAGGAMLKQLDFVTYKKLEQMGTLNEFIDSVIQMKLASTHLETSLQMAIKRNGLDVKITNSPTEAVTVDRWQNNGQLTKVDLTLGFEPEENEKAFKQMVDILRDHGLWIVGYSGANKNLLAVKTHIDFNSPDAPFQMNTLYSSTIAMMDKAHQYSSDPGKRIESFYSHRIHQAVSSALVGSSTSEITRTVSKQMEGLFNAYEEHLQRKMGDVMAQIESKIPVGTDSTISEELKKLRSSISRSTETNEYTSLLHRMLDDDTFQWTLAKATTEGESLADLVEKHLEETNGEASADMISRVAVVFSHAQAEAGKDIKKLVDILKRDTFVSRSLFFQSLEEFRGLEASNGLARNAYLAEIADLFDKSSKVREELDNFKLKRDEDKMAFFFEYLLRGERVFYESDIKRSKRVSLDTLGGANLDMDMNPSKAVVDFVEEHRAKHGKVRIYFMPNQKVDGLELIAGGHFMPESHMQALSPSAGGVRRVRKGTFHYPGTTIKFEATTSKMATKMPGLQMDAEFNPERDYIVMLEGIKGADPSFLQLMKIDSAKSMDNGSGYVEFDLSNEDDRARYTRFAASYTVHSTTESGARSIRASSVGADLNEKGPEKMSYVTASERKKNIRKAVGTVLADARKGAMELNKVLSDPVKDHHSAFFAVHAMGEFDGNDLELFGKDERLSVKIDGHDYDIPPAFTGALSYEALVSWSREALAEGPRHGLKTPRGVSTIEKLLSAEAEGAMLSHANQALLLDFLVDSGVIMKVDDMYFAGVERTPTVLEGQLTMFAIRGIREKGCHVGVELDTRLYQTVEGGDYDGDKTLHVSPLSRKDYAKVLGVIKKGAAQENQKDVDRLILSDIARGWIRGIEASKQSDLSFKQSDTPENIGAKERSDMSNVLGSATHGIHTGIKIANAFKSNAGKPRTFGASDFNIKTGEAQDSDIVYATLSEKAPVKPSNLTRVVMKTNSRGQITDNTEFLGRIDDIRESQVGDYTIILADNASVPTLILTQASSKRHGRDIIAVFPDARVDPSAVAKEIGSIMKQTPGITGDEVFDKFVAIAAKENYFDYRGKNYQLCSPTEAISQLNNTGVGEAKSGGNAYVYSMYDKDLGNIIKGTNELGLGLSIAARHLPGGFVFTDTSIRSYPMINRASAKDVTEEQLDFFRKNTSMASIIRSEITQARQNNGYGLSERDIARLVAFSNGKLKNPADTNEVLKLIEQKRLFNPQVKEFFRTADSSIYDAIVRYEEFTNNGLNPEADFTNRVLAEHYSNIPEEVLKERVFLPHTDIHYNSTRLKMLYDLTTQVWGAAGSTNAGRMIELSRMMKNGWVSFPKGVDPEKALAKQLRESGSSLSDRSVRKIFADLGIHFKEMLIPDLSKLDLDLTANQNNPYFPSKQSKLGDKLKEYRKMNGKRWIMVDGKDKVISVDSLTGRFESAMGNAIDSRELDNLFVATMSLADEPAYDLLLLRSQGLTPDIARRIAEDMDHGKDAKISYQTLEAFTQNRIKSGLKGTIDPEVLNDKYAPMIAEYGRKVYRIDNC